ncbi:MAG: winged helix-turn-helix domain-containing protein [candidate division Zixibacteria bacterium]|nr:winged helix-turn-helix domain-containing protein [candidate division Zixibacteria bacterium]
MKEKIGETAGKVWNILSEKEEVAISQLPKILKEKELLVYQALGWLAREDKIAYQTKGNKIVIRLSEPERKQ